MRLGGRLQAAIEVLQDIETKHRPASESLKDWGNGNRFAGAGDRAAIGNIVYDVLRKKHSLLWRMDSDSMKDGAYAALLNENGMDIATLDSLLEGDKFAPEPLESAQRHAWQSRNLKEAPLHIQADFPLWAVPYMENIFANHALGDISCDFIEQAKALNERPPLDLRINSLKATQEKVYRELHKSNVNVQSFSWFSQALRIGKIEKFGRHPNVQAEPAFHRGLFEIQDLGSQIVAKLANAKPGMQIFDYCAGAGGKTLALAADMENRGQIHAYDAEKARLAPIFERLKRAGVRNAQPHANSADLKGLYGKMDMVLLDAPCTGSGTWRRRPDAKWRLTESQVLRRVQEQKQVLKAALPYLKKGGRLVYITCSLFSKENDEQIANFLQENPNFHEMNMQTIWTENFDEKAPKPIFLRHGLVLSPKSTQTDGFYIAVLEMDT